MMTAQIGEELSLAEKMERVYRLALELIYPGDECTHPRDLDALFGEEVASEIWAWGDGLWHKWYHKRASGRCSLRAMLEFDVGDWEEKVDQFYQQFMELRAQLTAGA